MTRKRSLLALLVLTSLFFSIAFLSISSAHAGAKTVRKVLPNGMVVLVQEVHSAPVVAMEVWVRVGSADEDPDRGGISHVFEHMLFKGTPTKKVGEIARLVESVGGNINAYTSFDNTVYYLVVPSEHFATGLDVLSDAVQHSSFDPDELKKELKVVLEEIRMNKDSPMRTLYDKIFSLAYKKHPYGRPVIGRSEVVAKFTRKYILDVFNSFYRPENMTFVVAGDVDAEAVTREVEKAFAGFRRGNLKRRPRPVEPTQKEVRAEIVRQDINETYLGMAFHIPELKSDDTYAIDVLSGILASGVSSRLYRALKIETHLVHSISAYSMSLKDPGLFFITASLDAKNVSKATEKIITEIGRLGAEGPESTEFQRAKTNIAADFIYSRQTMQGISRDLGYYETIAGDYRYGQKYLAAVQALTPEDVRKVVNRYFTASNVSVAIVMPEKENKDLTVPAVKATVKKAFAKAARLGEKLKKTPAVKKTTLSNGITLIVKKIPTTPSVAFYATFPGGLMAENTRNNGIGNFMAAMLTRGTKTRTREELAKEVEGMAGSISGFSARNSTGVTAGFLSADFERGLRLFADVIENPTFPEKEMRTLRKDILAAIKKREDNIPSYTFKLLLKALYRDHPYGMPVSGTTETVKALTRADLISHYKKIFIPKRMILVIAGDVDVEYTIKKVREVFGGFTRKAVGIPAPQKPDWPKEIRRTGAEREKAQINIGIGFMATTIGSKDSYALSVLSEILSGQGGRLFINLRDRKSLAYSVSAFLRDGVDPGFFALYIASAPEKKDNAIEGLLRELESIRNGPVSDEELARARNYITGSYVIGLQTPAAQAADMANNELFGLGYDFSKKYIKLIQAVTKEDVLRVARKYLDLKAYTISIVGPKDKQDGGKDKAGRGTKKKG